MVWPHYAPMQNGHCHFYFTAPRVPFALMIQSFKPDITILQTILMKKQFVYISAAIACTTLLSGCGMMDFHNTPSTPIPDALKAPAGEVLVLTTPARGVQIYVCGPNKDDASRLEWNFKAPEADLLNHSGTTIGKHYAGPTWESADGSKVVGETKARDNGPDPKAIPWLLLSAKSNTGSGIFSTVKSVQRLQTVGGIAPAEACTAAQVGREARVPYTAVYNFYAPK
jgi:Protein of unknown function (DUF3455)